MPYKNKSDAYKEKTHCRNNHEFTPENTYVSKEGYRRCRTCSNAQRRKLCVHGKRRDACRACKDIGIGGMFFCEHNRKRFSCSLCNPETVYKDYARIEKKKNNGVLPEGFISSEYFCSLLKRRCWFCNRTPEQANGMGVDRTDNEKGHVYGNVETSCSVCNMMKKSLPREVFLQYCRDIVANHKPEGLA